MKYIKKISFVLLLFLTTINIQAEDSVSNEMFEELSLNGKRCDRMPVVNEFSNPSQVTLHLSLVSGELTKNMYLKIESEETTLYNGSLSGFEELVVGDLNPGEVKPIYFCLGWLSPMEKQDLDMVFEDFAWELEVQEIVSSASIEPEQDDDSVVEVLSETVEPIYPFIDRWGMLPVTGKLSYFILGMGVAGSGMYLISRKK